jgi:hypothetical protein
MVTAVRVDKRAAFDKVAENVQTGRFLCMVRALCRGDDFLRKRERSCPQFHTPQGSIIGSSRANPFIAQPNRSIQVGLAFRQPEVALRELAGEAGDTIAQ